MAMTHQKRYDVAVSPTAEAVKKALILIDGEAGRFLVMERAKAGIFPAFACQFDALPDHLRERDPRTDFIQESDGERQL
jgi:hypothetical protein